MSEAEITDGSNDPRVQGPGAGAWKRWGYEIRYTWAIVLLICVAPALVYGASFQAVFLLLAVVGFGVPAGLCAMLLKDKWWSRRLWRRLIVLGSIALITICAVSQTDKLTPGMATPIAEAIIQYKTDNAKYPASLVELSPKYIAEMPAVRAAVIQPSITYTVRDERPRLAIPSARGDAFANYEYDFKVKAWRHNY